MQVSCSTVTGPLLLAGVRQASCLASRVTTSASIHIPLISLYLHFAAHSTCTPCAGMSLEDTFQGARALFSNEEQRGGKAGSFVSAALTPISTHPTPRARRTALEDAMAAAGLPPPPPGAARKRRHTRWLRWL